MIAPVPCYAVCGILLALLPLQPCLPIVYGNVSISQRTAAPCCRFEEGRMLAALNDYREFHSSPPLKWSDKLASSADKLAAELSRQLNCNIPLYYRNELGTNYLSAALDGFSEAVAAQFWYEGHTDYDFVNGGPLNRNPNVLSFTQLVWKSSQEVGCSVACCDGRQVVLICRFNPPGNIQGHFTSNVQEKFERLNDTVKEVPYEL